MMGIFCKKCTTEKNESDFYLKPDGRPMFPCKKCKANTVRRLHLEKMKNPEYVEAQRERRKIKRALLREVLNEKRRLYYKNNTDVLKRRAKEYVEKNRDAVAKKKAAYRKANKEKIREYNANYFRKRTSEDEMFALKCSLRKMTHKAFKRRFWKKSSKSEDILGADYETVKLHIEKQFKKGMSWENRNLWQLDHIIPISIAKTKEDLIQLSHYTNLQPMWTIDNIRKSNKILKPQLKLAM